MYDCLWGTTRIRLIVIRDLPEKMQNYGMYFFSPLESQRKLAREHYREKDPQTSTLIRAMLFGHGPEESSMLPPKLQEFVKKYKQEMIEKMTPEEYREVVLNSERFRRLPPEERIKGLSDEELERLLEERRKKPTSDQ